jgi:hypothetical protein
VSLAATTPCRLQQLCSSASNRSGRCYMLQARDNVNKFRIGPTFTLPYFQVNRTTTGRQHMMTQDKIRIAVRMTQFRDTTQGRSSSQNSQPSAHCRHSNIVASLYWLSISCRQWRTPSEHVWS